MSWHVCRLFSLAMVTITVVLLPTTAQRRMSSSSQIAMTGPLARLPTVSGDNAALHCDTRPLEQKDTMLLVVWYRDEEPVYSFDTRKTGPSAYWIEESIQGRAQWSDVPTPSLHLQRVQPGDRAVYRCRVDFLKSPTKNYWIALDVIELPGKPVVLDEYGNEINNVAGPYKEGSDFKLTCSVKGGVPYPRMQWLRGESILMSIPGGDHDSEPVPPSRTLVLEIRNASRDHHSAPYTCTADNTILAPPLKTTVRVDMYLKPLTVEILYRELPLSVGRKAELWCKSIGARPPANITWLLNGEQLYSESKYLEVEGRNETLSRLEWTPTKEQNGKTLICKAQHTEFPGAALEAKLPLNVYYMPESTMRLGAKMNPNDIEEGDDVYFECEVDANPPAYKVIWEHNGLQLQHNPSNGVILTANTNLALRNITRHQAGNYTCTASNVEGDGKSPPLLMKVVYKPLCANGEMKLIGAALQEPTAIVCLVEAFPPPNTFDWILNNSMGSIKVDSQRYTVIEKEGKSVLTYTPVADVDYGTLSCRASNMAGQQVTPCVYTLLPATRPDPPSNCTVYNLTDDALDLTCLPGYEGGLQNVYLAEVWAPEGLVVNASNGVAVWNLRRLGAKRQLRFVVYAANARGRSEHVTFTVKTSPRQASRTEAHEAWEMNWAVGGILGAGVAVAIILCLAFIATRLRHRSRDYGVAAQSTKNHKSSHQKGASPDDCNPDIIPLSKDTSESLPEPPKYSAVVGRPESKNPSSSHSTARPQSPTPLPPYSSHTEMQGRNCANGAQRSHREIVTTRTPLLTAQESRV